MPEPVSPTSAVVVPAGTVNETSSSVQAVVVVAEPDVVEDDVAGLRDRERVGPLLDVDRLVEVLEDPVEERERRLHVQTDAEQRADGEEQPRLQRRERDERRDVDRVRAAASASPPNQYTAAGMTEKLVWIDAITQRPAMRWRTSRSASRSESASKRSASSVVRPIVLPSRIPETESDSWTRLEMSASVSCVVFAILRRSLPTRRVEEHEDGISANANSASCQLNASMPIIVATTVVTLDAIDVAVFVTTFWTPPMSFEIRDCTSPVRVRVKNASERRCRWRNTAARRSCITRWPTWFESSVWTTPRIPVDDRDRDHPRGEIRDLRRVGVADRVQESAAGTRARRRGRQRRRSARGRR